MKGDFSRATFDRKKHYGGVLLQQGRVQLDADWNEQVEIDAYLRQTEARDVVGLHGAPKTGGGFQVGVAAEGDDLTIAPGRIYVDGLLCENEEAVRFTQQPDFPGATVPPEDGLYLIYLDVWRRHITALEDPAIREVALGGPDTATRAKTVWQVKRLKAEGDPDAVSCETSPAEWDALVQPSSGTLSARRTSSGTTLENQLYRVEIHEGGSPGTAAFMWSRDNGAVAARIETVSGDTVTVRGLGGSAQTRFERGQWVALSDDGRTLRGEPSVLVELDWVQGNTLTVKSLPDGFSLDDLGACPIVRQWDSPGAIPITGGDYLDLEDGIQVQFGEGTYRTGDYWLIPARTATGDVEWPYDAPQPPRGIRHHFCRLALVEVAADGSLAVKEDCRETFSPLTRLDAGSGVARDVRQADHGFEVGQAIFYDGEAGAYALARSNQETTTGLFLVSAVRGANHFTLLQAGYLDGLTGLTPGDYYYVSDETPGALTPDEPFGISNPILYADSETGGYVLPYRPAESSQEMLKTYVDTLLVGMVAPFAMETPPGGWLECNGQALSRIEHARLFNSIGTTFGPGNGATTFNVPDLRGEFVRGWDHGREVDSGRILGSFQADQMQTHRHNDSGHGHGTSVQNHRQTGNGYQSGSGWVVDWGSINTGYANIGEPTGASHGHETRPRNVALLYCIKY